MAVEWDSSRTMCCNELSRRHNKYIFGQLRFVTPLQQIAAVVYALVRRQPFVSQNETTALLVLLYLCEQQGYRLLVPHRDIVTAIVNIHSDNDESPFYRWLHANVTVDDNSVN